MTRGETLYEWMETNKLTVINDGLKPTLIRHNAASYIDLTIINDKTTNAKIRWEVRDEETMSDHGYVLTTLEEKKKIKKETIL